MSKDVGVKLFGKCNCDARRSRSVISGCGTAVTALLRIYPFAVVRAPANEEMGQKRCALRLAGRKNLVQLNDLDSYYGSGSV